MKDEQEIPNQKSTFDDAATALVQSTVKDGVWELSAEISDSVMSNVLDIEMLKVIPIIGWVVKATKLVLSIRDRIFIKKIAMFLDGVGNIPRKERMQFIQDIREDPKQEQNVGETVLMLLDRVDDFEKASIIGKLFAAYIQKKIPFEWFKELSSAVERCNMSSLKKLLENNMRSKKPVFFKTHLYATETAKHVRVNVAEDLYRAGLVTMETRRDKGHFESSEQKPLIQKFKLNDLARNLITIITGNHSFHSEW